MQEIEYLFLVLSLVAIVLSVLAREIKMPLFDLFLDELERDSERKGMRAKGFVFYILGCTIAVEFFPLDIALAAIVILAIGDAVSRLIGPYGYLKHPWNSKKFVEGVFLGGVFAAIGALIFVGFWQAIAGAAVAMFIEGLDLEVNGYKVDDNLTIPVASALVMLLVVLL